jgi:hypothetical protein
MEHQRVVKLLDYGLAKDIQQDGSLKTGSLTQQGRILGTPAYMSPEQAKGEISKVGKPSDIYSLGVVFYQMLSRKLPFESDTPWGVMHKHISEPPVPLRQVNPEVPQALEQIVMRCLEKEIDKRYPSALAVKHDLAKVASSTVGARHASPLQETSDNLTKDAAPTTIVGAQHAVPFKRRAPIILFVVIMLAITGGLWGYMKTTQIMDADKLGATLLRATTDRDENAEKTRLAEINRKKRAELDRQSQEEDARKQYELKRQKKIEEAKRKAEAEFTAKKAKMGKLRLAKEEQKRKEGEEARKATSNHKENVNSKRSPFGKLHSTTRTQCYQETATVANGCGAVGGGSYSANGAWNDGVWDRSYTTIGARGLYVTYVKPPGAIKAKLKDDRYLWNSKHGTEVNAIPQQCWDAGSTIQLWIHQAFKDTRCGDYKAFGGQYCLYIDCFDGKSWDNRVGGSGSVNSSAHFNTIYEEAITWTILQ